MTDRNTIPADAFDAMRRLLACNWTQLAERLGVTRQTLHAWRASADPGDDARRRMRELFTATVRASRAEWIAENHERAVLLQSLLEHAAEDPAALAMEKGRAKPRPPISK